MIQTFTITAAGGAFVIMLLLVLYVFRWKKRITEEMPGKITDEEAATVYAEWEAKKKKYVDKRIEEERILLDREKKGRLARTHSKYTVPSSYFGGRRAMLEINKESIYDTIQIFPGYNSDIHVRFDPNTPHANGNRREVGHEVSYTGSPLPNPRIFQVDRLDLSFEDAKDDGDIQELLRAIYIRFVIGVKSYLDAPATVFAPVGMGKNLPPVTPWRIYGHPIGPKVVISPQQNFFCDVVIRHHSVQAPRSVKIILRGMMGREIM